MAHEESTGNDPLVVSHNKYFSDIFTRLDKLAEGDMKRSYEIVEIKQSLKIFEYRQDAQEKTVEAITNLATSVNFMVKQIEGMITILEKHDDKIEVLERTPGTLAINGWKFILVLVVTGVSGILFGRLF